MIHLEFRQVEHFHLALFLMSPLLNITGVLVYISAFAWAYLYLYPLWLGCGFPLTQTPSLPPARQQSFPFFQHNRTREAPFRLLVLADPQLEGDTSLHNPTWSSEVLLSPQKFGDTLLRSLKYWRKRIDLWGNDLYLAHIYRSLQTFTKPTHVTVLGDLLGSQWISDDEFERRADRFWDVVFAGGLPVPEYVTRQPHHETLGENPQWSRSVIAVVGNHDVGYAGDMNKARVERFERRFGRVNWEVDFELPVDKSKAISGDAIEKSQPPSIRISVLNSMNLDTPAFVESLQSETYAALNGFIERSRDVSSKDVFTILLTHVPLHKSEGICADAPMFDYFPEDNGRGIKEQNMLSEHSSKTILEGIFGMSDTSPGRKGIILTGHDHVGCDVWHYLPPEGTLDTEHRWNATSTRKHLRTNVTAGLPGIREVTLRAMMGEYGGNAAFLSAWYDEEEQDWGYAVTKCMLGSQHVWWAIHVLLLVTVLSIGAATVEYQRNFLRRIQTRRAQRKQKEREEEANRVNGAETVAKSTVQGRVIKRR